MRCGTSNTLADELPMVPENTHAMAVWRADSSERTAEEVGSEIQPTEEVGSEIRRTEEVGSEIRRTDARAANTCGPPRGRGHSP